MDVFMVIVVGLLAVAAIAVLIALARRHREPSFTERLLEAYGSGHRGRRSRSSAGGGTTASSGLWGGGGSSWGDGGGSSGGDGGGGGCGGGGG